MSSTFAGFVQTQPDRVAVVDGTCRLTRQELYAQAQRLGTALMDRGLAAGASIAFQLPNWHEACVINLAAWMYGFRLVPLLPMYREAEIGLILQETAPDAIFLAERIRDVAHVDLFERVKTRAIPAARVFIVRGSHDRYGGYEDLLASRSPLRPPSPASPGEVRMVLYTSGSTGKAKGVLHTHASLAALAAFTRDFWQLSAADTALVPSPVAHIGGSLYAFDYPLQVGMTAVLMDRWLPERAVDLIESESVTFCAGATPFLADLLKVSEERGTHLCGLRRFVCGGASVPSSLVRRASAVFLNCTVSRAYGSTEVPVICPGVRSRLEQEPGATTDGEICADILLLDSNGLPVGQGEVGEIVARAPRMFAGYLRAQDNQDAFTPDGYFRMGDLGRVVDGRYLEITGRKKDIIIRLGENISPLEVENALCEHPAVRQVAIVGVPDARTGEAALAFVVLHPQAEFSLAEMSRFLAARGMARQKFPEYLRIVDRLPSNSVGKVLKRELQAMALGGSADMPRGCV
jgi:acyl-CoA synthetase (AMP-forming)/AMP-acid ligase II